MNEVFSHFSLPQIAAVSRRTALCALLMGVAGLVVSGLVGYLLVGIGLCVGITLALINFRLIQAATVKASTSGRENTRRPLAMNTLARLGAISVVALGVTYFSHRLGFGILLGLAFFQFTLLANVVTSMFQQARADQASGDGASGGATGSGPEIKEGAL